jgi:hypothetical protein
VVGQFAPPAIARVRCGAADGSDLGEERVIAERSAVAIAARRLRRTRRPPHTGRARRAVDRKLTHYKAVHLT